MESIEPLSSQQQLFLQRFLASHVLTNHEAQSLYDEILQRHDDDDDDQQNDHKQQEQRNELGRDVNHTLSRINRSLKPAFRLEIKSVNMALPLPKNYHNNNNDDDGHNNDDDDDNDDDNNHSSTQDKHTKPKSIVYHTIVNCDSDEVAKSNANPTFTKSPHELAYFRLLLERFVEKDSHDNSNNTTATNRRGKGCQSFMSRIDMINLRLELEPPHKDKLTITQVEHVLDLLEVQGWFVPANPSYDDDDENDSGGISTSTPDNHSSRKRRRNNSRNGNTTATTTAYLQIGPRSYLEYPDFLIKAGLENDQLPQFLLHG